LAVSVSGSSLNQLSAALGKFLPNIAPYDLEGRLTHQGTTWKIADFEGDVGESSLSGNVAVDVARRKPYIQADLYARMLKSDDFAGLFAKSHDAQTETRRPPSRTTSQRAHAPVNFNALRTLNAEIHLEA
jgi:hypothetical protein